MLIHIYEYEWDTKEAEIKKYLKEVIKVDNANTLDYNNILVIDLNKPKYLNLIDYEIQEILEPQLIQIDTRTKKDMQEIKTTESEIYNIHDAGKIKIKPVELADNW